MEIDQSQKVHHSDTWVHDFGSFKMVLYESDLDFSRQVKYLGNYSTESLEAKVFEKYLKPGARILDLGANIGFYTLLASSKVGTSGHVIAVEPSPKNFKLINLSVEANSFSNVNTINAAVSDFVGKSFLHLSPYYNSEHSLFNFHYSSGHVNNTNKISIDVTTVDKILEDSPDYTVDLIKMDIEGSESKTLSGMQRVLDENDHLVLITEFWPKGFENANSNPLDFLKKLEELNFKIHHIDEAKGHIYNVTADEMDNIMKNRMNTPSEKTKTIQSGGWYTNLLCSR
jgi:FkbM family methyltransferase